MVRLQMALEASGNRELGGVVDVEGGRFTNPLLGRLRVPGVRLSASFPCTHNMH